MTFHVITLLPKLFEPYLKASIIGRGVKKGLIRVSTYDLSQFLSSKKDRVDDKAYGGGPGMVIKLAPLVKALTDALGRKPKKKTLVISLEPGGQQLDQKMVIRLHRSYRHLVLIAGRYEGFDDRIKRIISDMGWRWLSLSVGPYVLTGGELPALTLIDAVARQIEGVLGKKESLEEKRYGVGVPTFTRPEIFRFRGHSYRVPPVLVSGDHKLIEQWRRQRQGERH